jgi:hypothetical protein
MTPREKEIRAAGAQQLLDNSLRREVHAQIERDAIEAALNAETPEEAWRHLDMARANRKHEATLQTILMDGTAAQRPRGRVA